jgi:hypothetical protein
MPHVPPPPDPEVELLAVLVVSEPAPPPLPPAPPVPPVPPMPPMPPVPPAPSKQLPLMHCCPAGQTVFSQGQLSQAPVFGSQQLPSTHVGLGHRFGAHAGVGRLRSQYWPSGQGGEQRSTHTPSLHSSPAWHITPAHEGTHVCAITVSLILHTSPGAHGFG